VGSNPTGTAKKKSPERSGLFWLKRQVFSSELLF
jgi:hypothetical protein